MDHILLFSSSQRAPGEVHVELVAIELLLWGETRLYAYTGLLLRSSTISGTSVEWTTFSYSVALSVL